MSSNDRLVSRIVLSGSAVDVVTLDARRHRNALSGDLVADLARCLAESASDRAVGVTVLTGTGTVFCAGGDLKAMMAGDGMFVGEASVVETAYRETVQHVVRSLRDLPHVTIAAINGPAVGAGVDLAAACDLRVASKTASFSYTFAELGLAPGAGGPWLLTRLVGVGRCADMALTGRVVGSEEALAWGLVNEVVAFNRLERRSLDLAKAIASRPIGAVTAAKRLLNSASTPSFEEYQKLSAAVQAVRHASVEHAAAMERLRKPIAPD